MLEITVFKGTAQQAIKLVLILAGIWFTLFMAFHIAVARKASKYKG